MIIALTRGHITIRVQDKVYRIQGELLSGGEFIIYRSDPFLSEDGEKPLDVDEFTKERILAIVVKEAKMNNGVSIEIE